MESFQDFVGRFQYDPIKALWIGVEREGFLFNDKGSIRPVAHLILQSADSDGRFTHELSACQIESRVGPCLLSDLANELQGAEGALNEYVVESNRRMDILPALADWLCDYPEEYLSQISYEDNKGIYVGYMSVAPENMPLDIYLDKTGRYQKITKNMSQDILSAACRVAGTHIHIGMPSKSVALEVYNGVISNVNRLCAIGDNSNGSRLSIYKKMAPDFLPIPYENWEHFYKVASQKGFATDPRRCWHLIRLSVHGTIEFRMFGSTPCMDQIIGWATECRRLCADQMSR